MTTPQSRERYEHPDMPPGEVRPATAWALIVASALLIVAVPVWRQAGAGHSAPVAALVSPDASGSEPSAGLTALSRSLMRRVEAVEQALEMGSPLRDAFLAPAQWALLNFGGAGNETVYVGAASPTWLVLRSGFDHVTGPAFLDADVLERRRRADPSHSPPLHPDPRPALLDFHRQLKERGVQLVFLPVPSKPAVHPESLGALPEDAGARNPSLAALLTTLRGAGVQVLDPRPLLTELAARGEPAYLRTDSHWSPAAVDAVASTLAAELERLVELGPRDRDWTRAPFERRGRGDLWRALDLPAGRPLLPEESVRVDEVTSWDGLLWAPVHNASVMLLGDSFSTVYSDDRLHWGSSAGLAEQLAYHLGRDVDRLARPDGSSDQVRRDLAREPGRLNGVRVLVYQVATRELSLGDWPLVKLEPLGVLPEPPKG